MKGNSNGHEGNPMDLDMLDFGVCEKCIPNQGPHVLHSTYLSVGL